MRGEKFIHLDTNAIHVGILQLSHPSSKSSVFEKFLHSSKVDKGPTVQFNVWDYGGKAIFHSIHRFFVTSNTLYLVVYDMSKPETLDTIMYTLVFSYANLCPLTSYFRYWIEQIGATSDIKGTKPIIVVGTHADCLPKHIYLQKIAEIEQAFGRFKKNRYQVQGHFAVNLLTGNKKRGLLELKEKLIEIATTHSTIQSIQVPRDFVILQKKLNNINKLQHCLRWQDYVILGQTLGNSLLCSLFYAH